ncbi:hypothetical protein IWQ61_006259 [Dispira simplex]|nr:hypothetical protein IWQ61_006259 [Dispira simplex]
MASPTYQLFVGCIVNPKTLTQLDIALQSVLVVHSPSGTITDFIISPSNLDATVDQLKQRYGDDSQVKVVRLKPGQFLLPGFIDTHVHASQFANMGLGYDMPLLDWLNTYTFPEEAKFLDRDYAQRMYQTAVKTLVQHGTTTAVYYGTIFTDTCCDLVDIVRRIGQRAWVGKVNMDRNAPHYYVEDTQQSLDETERFIHYVQDKTPSPSNLISPSDSAVTSVISDQDDIVSLPLVMPVITPRFVGSCSPRLMQGLADMAAKYQLPVQSHLSENLTEVAWVRTLHPECTSYADVYRTYGLLNTRTVMAHGVHLEPEEIRILKEHDVGMSHCPNSNFGLCSGVAPVRRWLVEAGLNVGLGTDVSGGSSPSIIDAMRQAMVASRILHMRASLGQLGGASDTQDESPILTVNEVLYLATMGGAQVLGWSHRLGNFDIGKMFDALICDVSDLCYEPPVPVINPVVGWAKRLEKFVYFGGSQNITSVYVQGRCIHHRSEYT